MSVDPSPRPFSQWIPIVWSAALAAAMAWQPIRAGAASLDVLAFDLYVALYVVVPGWLAYRLFRARDDDWLMQLGMSSALGYALHALAFVLLKITGLAALAPYYAVVIVPLALASRRRAAAPPRADEHGIRASAAGSPLALVRANAPRVAHLLFLLALLVVAVQRTPHYPVGSYHWLPNLDFQFHAGNAAELAHRWPLEDPRFAGEPLRYHFFSYALFAGASQVTGIAVNALLGCVGASAIVVLLGLQLFNAGRAIASSSSAGVIAAALVLLHVDVGQEVGMLFTGDVARAMKYHFNSYLLQGVYLSVTTCTGLVLVATLAIVVRRLFTAPEDAWKRWLALLVPFGSVTSGVKGSVMPVVLGGLVALVVFEFLPRRFVRRAAAALACLALAAAPMTLFLVSDDEGYAAAMFHWAPGLAMRTSSAFGTATGWIGSDPNAAPAWWLAAATPLWLAGYLGVVTLGVVAWMLRGPSAWTTTELFLAFIALAGLPLSLLLGSPGQSQLFFLYNGQIALAILAGGVFVSFAHARSRASVVALALAIVGAVPFVSGSLREITAPGLRDVPKPPGTDALREAIEWIREHTEPDAVILRDGSELVISVYGERRAFYETDRFTPEHLSWGWDRSGGAPRVVEDMTPSGVARFIRQQVFFERPSPARTREVCDVLRGAPPIYAMVDSLTMGFSPRYQAHYRAEPLDPRQKLPPAPFLETVFANDVAVIYRIKCEALPRESDERADPSLFPR